MKTRVKKKHFETVKSDDLIGIKWSGGEKGILLVSKEGIICLNNNEIDIRNCIATLTKADYLTREVIKKGLKKVYVFENLQSLLKWFAKK